MQDETLENEVIEEVSLEGLQYKEDLTLISGGYTGEDIGSDGLIKNWTDVTEESGSNTISYHYRDSDSGNNNNSSRVVIRITDEWSVIKNEDRSFTVTVHSKIDSIVRDDIKGSPGSTARNIFIRRTKGSAVLWSKSSDPIATAHTIATNIDLGTSTFTLTPSTGTGVQGTLYLRNNALNHDGDKTPSAYVDEFWVGINFRNNLPKDYRPGMHRVNGAWKSHDRTSGKCHHLVSGTWTEMRTTDGHIKGDNPPLKKVDGQWTNQLRLGEN